MALPPSPFHRYENGSCKRRRRRRLCPRSCFLNTYVQVAFAAGRPCGSQAQCSPGEGTCLPSHATSPRACSACPTPSPKYGLGGSGLPGTSPGRSAAPWGDSGPRQLPSAGKPSPARAGPAGSAGRAARFPSSGQLSPKPSFSPLFQGTQALGPLTDVAQGCGSHNSPQMSGGYRSGLVHGAA